MRVVWSPEAVADMEAAIEYLAERNPEAAERLARGIVAVAEHLASDPVEGPEHVLSNGDRVRGWPHRPFRIYYQRRADALVILRVYHQRRMPIVR